MTRLELKQAVQLALDPAPDERGQLTALALVQGGQVVALTLTTN